MDTHRKIQDQRERSLSLLIKAVCKSSHSHGFPMCPKSQAGKARAHSWCPPRQGAHYRKRTLNLEIHHFYSKQKQVGSLGKDLISTLKFAHLETESHSDVWVRKRQTFLARTYRTFRTIGNGVSHHSCPKWRQMRGTPGSVLQMICMLLCPALGHAQLVLLP